jgi:hypothetical protein
MQNVKVVNRSLKNVVEVKYLGTPVTESELYSQSQKQTMFWEWLLSYSSES